MKYIEIRVKFGSLTLWSEKATACNISVWPKIIWKSQWTLLLNKLLPAPFSSRPFSLFNVELVVQVSVVSCDQILISSQYISPNGQPQHRSPLPMLLCSSFLSKPILVSKSFSPSGSQHQSTRVVTVSATYGSNFQLEILNIGWGRSAKPNPRPEQHASWSPKLATRWNTCPMPTNYSQSNAWSTASQHCRLLFTPAKPCPRGACSLAPRKILGDDSKEKIVISHTCTDLNSQVYKFML